MSASYFLYGSILEKCGNFWKNGRFSGRIWPDWGNTARADMAGLGSIGLKENDNWIFCIQLMPRLKCIVRPNMKTSCKKTEFFA